MRKRTLSCIGVGCLAGLVLAQPSAAQDFNRFAFSVGGGFTNPVRHTEGRLNMGFNLGAGAGVNFTPHLGMNAEFGFNHMNLSERTLSLAGVPGGDARIYSVTLNPIVRFNPHGRFDAYLTGGGGYYRRSVDYTEPGIGEATFFDPYFGVFFPAAVPTTTVLATFIQNKGGVNVGGGISVRIKGDSNAKIFAEARYHHMFTSPVRTSYLPVTFGLRW
jgi:opacity protein-like surface antigen